MLQSFHSFCRPVKKLATSRFQITHKFALRFLPIGVIDVTTAARSGEKR